MIKEIILKFKSIILSIGSLLIWLMPLTLLILAICLPRLIWHPSFHDYLEFLKIIVWPFTALTILFFFREVVTYLFFSMNEFNFFGAKGKLRNVNDVIIENVNKKFLEEKNESRRRTDIEKLNKNILLKEKEVQVASGNAKENLDLAKEIFSKYKKLSEEHKEAVLENERLRDAVNCYPKSSIEEASLPDIDNSETSDAVLEENSQ